MHPYIVSTPHLDVATAYARWKDLRELPERTVMDDGWTLPSLQFAHLYQAQASSLDLAMVSGSIRPYQPAEILITEFRGDTKDLSA